jgi:hypothetical protein
MAMQGGRVQLEQCEMFLALNMAKMAKWGCLRTVIEKIQYLIKEPCAEVRENKIQGVEFPQHQKVKTVIKQHPAMLCQTHMAGCLSWQNGNAKYPLTTWRCKATAAPLPIRRGQQTAEPNSEPTPQPTPPLAGTPPSPTGKTSTA